VGRIVDIPKQAAVVGMPRTMRHHRGDGCEMMRSDAPQLQVLDSVVGIAFQALPNGIGFGGASL
jgi:hypothetical protein